MFGKDELAAILKFGAEELFREDERAKVEKQHELLAEDLDAILARAEVLPCAWSCVVGAALHRTRALVPAVCTMPHASGLLASLATTTAWQDDRPLMEERPEQLWELSTRATHCCLHPQHIFLCTVMIL